MTGIGLLASDWCYKPDHLLAPWVLYPGGFLFDPVRDKSLKELIFGLFMYIDKLYVLI